MMALGLLLPDVFWNVTFFLRMLTGKRFAGLTDYMFDSENPSIFGRSRYSTFFCPSLFCG
jgi:hypothetical protein